MISYYLTVITIVLGVGAYLWIARTRRRAQAGLAGSAFPVSSARNDRPLWEVYKEWSDACGSTMIHLMLQRSDVVVINDYPTAHELLVVRSLDYSSRPHFPMMDLIGRQDNVVVQKYGQRLKIARQMINDTFGSRKSEEWLPVVQTVSSEFLSRLLADPADFRRSIQRYVGTFTTRLTYGKDLDTDYLRLVDQVGEHVSQAAVPGRWWVNSYPFLRYYPSWAPGGGFQRWARHARGLFREFTLRPFNSVKEQLQRSPDTVPFSFVQKNLIQVKNDPSMETIVAGTAASLYSAAVDTTSSILTTFFLLMATHPHIQEKAAAEIREVVGQDRLPNLGDAGDLPYVEALIKELHRYHPVVRFLTRSASKSDEHGGHLVPQNAWVLTNIWAITRNKSEFEDPDQFDPDRFIQGGTHINDIRARDPRDFTFGMGRRRCPGMAIANAAVYLAITRVLATFLIKPVKDEGSNSAPQIEFTKSTIS
ncbi:hypothetical protein D9756_009110 [Leucocoprinus leucothites]|uniref:Cytochrome P450 n=1 Tax=Leucocoprinus leucothites TaxID=201217 RepID=A0A8H5CXX9_9AGAR|nr:hypothetical protein D9756_009110 [Leucoagaricus leucothites]